MLYKLFDIKDPETILKEGTTFNEVIEGRPEGTWETWKMYSQPIGGHWQDPKTFITHKIGVYWHGSETINGQHATSQYRDTVSTLRAKIHSQEPTPHSLRLFTDSNHESRSTNPAKTNQITKNVT